MQRTGAAQATLIPLSSKQLLSNDKWDTRCIYRREKKLIQQPWKYRLSKVLKNADEPVDFPAKTSVAFEFRDSCLGIALGSQVLLKKS